ncbi:unnamed protein product [Mesocestoides corti]|uniref:Uncharacterized protein n=1 Tax=Mesocestoides corti TaxID=53468 RepID=A0A0R3UQ09_MESCO|nr:unnamed protein product [Mesocestoides corti]
MRPPQTPCTKTAAGRTLKSSKNWHTKNALNISRKILQKSVCQQNRRVDTLQLNNVQLARRVSELQKELTQRDAELQVSREEAFQLRMQLNRLQNNTFEPSLYTLRDILASMVEESYKAHQIASNACSKLTSAATCDASTAGEDSVALERSINMSFANIEATSPATPGSVLAVGQPALSDAYFEGEPCQPTEVPESEYPATRESAQSVDMDCDSFTRTSTSTGRTMDVVQAAIPVTDGVVEVDPPTSRTGSSPESALLATSDDEYVPASMKRARRKGSSRNSRRKARPKPRSKARPPDKPSPTKTVYSLDTSSDHHFVAPELKEDVSQERILKTGENAPKLASPINLDSPEKVIVVDKPAVSEVQPTSKPQHRMPKRKRKRLKLIADDSVFIPISDAMMVNCSNRESGLNNENASPSAAEKAPSTGKTPSRTSEKRRPLSMMDDRLISRIHRAGRDAKPVLPPTWSA